MTNTANLQALHEIPLFEGLSREQLTRIHAKLHRKTFPAGSHIISADQIAEAMYIVVAGSVKIFLTNADGSEVTLAMLGPGQILGEMSILDDASRSANVVTVEETALLWMDRPFFKACLREMPRLTDNLMRELTSRLRQANRQIEALATLDVAARVTRQILGFARQYGEATPEGGVWISLPLTQTDIADIVGATRERVNRVMVALKRRGYLTVSRDHHITVLDVEALAGEAE